MPISEQQRKANVRLGLILATLALVFGLGFVVRLVVLGG
jgi:hypothetical protein